MAGLSKHSTAAEVLAQLRAIGSEYVPAQANGKSEPLQPDSFDEADKKPQISRIVHKLYNPKQPNIRLGTPDIQSKHSSFESLGSKASKDSKDSLAALSQQVSKATEAIISTVSPSACA